MENRKKIGCISIITMLMIIALVMTACSSAPKAPPAEVLAFDNVDISVMQARGAVSGIEDGVLYFSNAKTTLESGTYEILITRQRSVDARPYQYLEFDIMADNLDLLDDFVGFFPRLRTGETYTQFNGSAGLNRAIANVPGVNEWVTVTVSIASSNAHERAEDFRVVMPRVDSLLLRFICNDMDRINGKIFLRNFRFN